MRPKWSVVISSLVLTIAVVGSVVVLMRASEAIFSASSEIFLEQDADAGRAATANVVVGMQMRRFCARALVGVAVILCG